MKTINFRGNRLFSMMNKNPSRYESVIDDSGKRGDSQTIVIDDTPANLQSNRTTFYFALQSKITINGNLFKNEDIIKFDGASQSFRTYFDGSDVGLGRLAIDAFDIISDNEILLSFSVDTTIAGMAVDDSDIVKFTATQLGKNTAGTFSMWFDGSDVGLRTNGEDIDSLQLLQDGSFLISTRSNVRVPGMTVAQDRDILHFTPTSLGSNTAGTWSVYYDGSDVGLNTFAEDITAIAIDTSDPTSDQLYLSTVGNSSVPGVGGKDEDVLVFNPTTTGTKTSGNFNQNLFFDGSRFGLTTADIWGLDLAIGFGNTNVAPVAKNDRFTLDANSTLNINKTQGVLANDSDPDGDTLRVKSYSNVSHGNLTLYTSGAFNYTPNAGYIGKDSFTYNVSDGEHIKNATVTLIVKDTSTPPPLPKSEFNIEIKFIDNSLTSSQKALFTSAANRWSEIIIKDVPDQTVGGQLIDDLLIKASAANIDGVSGVLGNGRPTSVRSASYLPVLGEMKIDISDINNLESNGILDDVILHEMGHTLGLGSKTIWNHFSLVTGRGTSNPRFTGAQAIAQYNDLFGINATSVPLGTSCSHWRDSVFPNEIMTEAPVLGDNAISSVTVGALADMGYEVNFAAADNFVV